MSSPVLRVEGFGVAFNGRTVLDQVNFELPETGMTLLVGPSGGGKSTLLRTLAGLNCAHPALATWGTAKFLGESIDCRAASGDAHHEPSQPRPALVMQHARFFMDSVRENLVSALPNRGELDQREQTALVSAHLVAHGLQELVPRLDMDVVGLPLALQRRLALVRALLSDPAALFVDESTSGLEEQDANEIVASLSAQARRRAVLFVTHNQAVARALGGTTLLLAGGRIHERSETARFFDHPATELGRQFVRTGGCNAPSPSFAEPSTSDEVSTKELPAQASRSRFLGPRGFFWAAPGLGGAPRPGIIDPLEYDLEGLRRLGVELLITLEEQPTVPTEALAAHGIRSRHFPIVDMSVPDITAALELCANIQAELDRGKVVALHCRAGLGRTGTMLACQLIYQGYGAHTALDRLRAINPRCVQSEAQLEFLRQFAISVC
jgi:atypical dual specificity phosphatase